MTTIGREWLDANRNCPCDGDWNECPYCIDDLVFTSDGPNRCTCGCTLEGTDYWDDGEGMPFATCKACGLHYVIEADGDRVMVPEVEGADMDVGDDVEISRDQQGNYEVEAGHDYGR